MAQQTQYWLSIDFSRGAGSLALHAQHANQLRLLGSVRLMRDLAQAETGLETLSRLLEDCGVRLDAVTVCLTSTGPGSFTGLRIALSTLKAFYQSLRIPIESFFAPEIRALEAVHQTGASELIVLTTLGPQKRHWAQFKKVASGVQYLADGLATAAEDLAARFMGHQFVVEEEATNGAVGIPLEAELLGKYRLHAQRRVQSHDLDAVAALSPTYEGSTEYVTIAVGETPKP